MPIGQNSVSPYSEAELAELNALLDVGDRKAMRLWFCARNCHAYSKGRCLDCGEVEPSEL